MRVGLAAGLERALGLQVAACRATATCMHAAAAALRALRGDVRIIRRRRAVPPVGAGRTPEWSELQRFSLS